jgi:hypothetical protein
LRIELVGIGRGERGVADITPTPLPISLQTPEKPSEPAPPEL